MNQLHLSFGPISIKKLFCGKNLVSIWFSYKIFTHLLLIGKEILLHCLSMQLYTQQTNHLQKVLS